MSIPEKNVPSEPDFPQKILEFVLNENQNDDIPEASEISEEIYTKNFFANHKIFLKISIPEKIMEKFNNVLFQKIFSCLNLIKDGVFKDVIILKNFVKKIESKKISLEILEKPQLTDQEISQTFSLIFSAITQLIELDINFEKDPSFFKIVNETFSKISPFLETLNLSIKYNNPTQEDTCFMGKNLEYLKNLKNFKLHLKEFALKGNYFLKFFKNFVSLKNLVSLEIIFEKMLIENEDLKEIFEILLNKQIPKLKILKLGFFNVDLGQKESFSNFCEKISELNISEFSLRFGYSAIDFLPPILEKVSINVHIKKLEIKVIESDMINDFFPSLNKFLEKFPNILTLELSLCQTKLRNEDATPLCKIFELENIKKLEYLRLIMAYNNFSDDFGRHIFTQMKALKNLKFLFIDFQQSWQASYYFTESVKTNVTELISELTKLQSILLNFNGNELKRDGNKSYDFIESHLKKIQDEHKVLKHYKLFERSEADIGTGNIPNYVCHLPFEYFFKENNDQNLNLIPAVFDKFELIIREPQLQKDYLLHKTNELFSKIGFKTFFRDKKVILENPIYNPSNQESMSNRINLTNDFKENFLESLIIYSYLFNDNEECKFLPPPSVKIEEDFKEIEEIKNLKSKEISKMNKLLSDLYSAQQKAASLYAKTPLFVELLCQNEDVLINFSVQHFENMMKNFNPDDSKSVNLFLNQIFRTTLNVNMESDIPALILSTKGYCKFLTCESFAFLSFYAKNISKIDTRGNLTENQKAVHKKKISSITSLHLEENQYFSTRSCKESLLNLIDNKWKLIKLRSPDYFYDNDNFVIQTKKERKFSRTSAAIQNSINEFYSNIREAIKDFELVSLDDFYGDFILNLFSNLPDLKDINVSNMNLGDKFCEGFNTFIAAEKKKLNGRYRFINLEIMNNLRITNVGLKFLYVSYQIMRNYFRKAGSETLPKLKVFAVLIQSKKKTKYGNIFKKGGSKEKKNQDLKLNKITKKVRRKKQIGLPVSKKNTSSINLPPISKENSGKAVINVEEGGRDEYEEVDVTDEEATNKNTQNLQILIDIEEKAKLKKIVEEEKKLEEKNLLEINKKNMDDTNETIILNEGLGAFIQYFVKGFGRPKRIFCYNCDLEVCKECHVFHPKFAECQPEFIICQKCNEIHHRNLIDCKIENQEQVICRGYRQILTKQKKNLKSYRFKMKRKNDNKCLVG